MVPSGGGGGSFLELRTAVLLPIGQRLRSPGARPSSLGSSSRRASALPGSCGVRILGPATRQTAAAHMDNRVQWGITRTS